MKGEIFVTAEITISKKDGTWTIFDHPMRDNMDFKGEIISPKFSIKLWEENCFLIQRAAPSPLTLQRVGFCPSISLAEEPGFFFEEEKHKEKLLPHNCVHVTGHMIIFMPVILGILGLYVYGFNAKLPNCFLNGNKSNVCLFRLRRFPVKWNLGLITFIDGRIAES